jgi:phytoene synthase
VASWLLPREKRRGAYAVYAFCRLADDIVDLSGADGSAGDAERRLATYRQDLESALRGTSSSPVLRELAWAVGRFGIGRASLDSLLDGVTCDLGTFAYESWPDLQGYCQGVASSVGEMCAAVFGIGGDSRDADRALVHARTLGVAMQLTNILRDVGEDAARDRCYLPSEDLARFGLSRREVLSGEARSKPGAWRALMAFEIARARDLYGEAMPGIALISPDARRCAHACASGYAAILGAIERNAYDTFTRRASLGRLDRAGIFVASWLGRMPQPTPIEAPNGSAPPRHVPA